LKRILDFLRDEQVDHLVITGDLIDNADKSDFKLLRSIFKDYGLLNTKKMSVVIGNHDIFGGIETAEDIVNFPKKCFLIDYKEKMKDFYRYFTECFEDCFFPSKVDDYPFAKDLGPVVLIGLNSISKYSRLRNAFASNGKISNSQIDALKKIFEKKEYSDKKKIIMIHHHFCKYYQNYAHKNGVWANVEKFTLKLRGKKKLINLFKKHNVNLILHGHLHESNEYYKDGLRILNGGGSVDSNGESYLKINMINFENNDILTKIITLPKYRFEKKLNKESKKIFKNAVRKHDREFAEV